jgi:hypothetical protein
MGVMGARHVLTELAARFANFVQLSQSAAGGSSRAAICTKYNNTDTWPALLIPLAKRYPTMAKQRRRQAKIRGPFD